jgi:hypothetical protein
VICPVALERKLARELHNARVTGAACHSEGSAVQVPIGSKEIGMIEDVKRLRSECEADSLCAQGERLHHGWIDVNIAGSTDAE